MVQTYFPDVSIVGKKREARKNIDGDQKRSSPDFGQETELLIPENSEIVAAFRQYLMSQQHFFINVSLVI